MKKALKEKFYIGRIVQIKEGIYADLFGSVRHVHTDGIEIKVLGFTLPAGYSGPFQILDFSSVKETDFQESQAIRMNRKRYDMSSSHDPR